MSGPLQAIAARWRTGGTWGAIHSAAFRLGFAIDPARVALWALSLRPRFTIVQIGAFVGDTDNDPLHAFIARHVVGKGAKAARRVILVEPVREHFQKLERLYAGCKNVILENVAVADRSGKRPMYRLGVDPVEHGFPAWLSQLSSLKGERMESLWDSYEGIAEYKAFYLRHRVTEIVECVTLAGLLEKHGFKGLDFLQIDAEGFDYEIIKSIDFAATRPRFINYEYVLLGADRAACRALLLEKGYGLLDQRQDTLAIRRG